MIYFIQGTCSRLIKIGRADRPRARLRELQIGSPDQLKIIGVMYSLQYGEKELHQLFEKHHSHGEWFRPAAELEAFIGAHCHPDVTGMLFVNEFVLNGHIGVEQAITSPLEELIEEVGATGADAMEKLLDETGI